MIIKTNLFSTKDIAEIIGEKHCSVYAMEQARQSKYKNRFTVKIPEPVKKIRNDSYYDENGVEKIKKFFKSISKQERKILNFVISAEGKWKGIMY